MKLQLIIVAGLLPFTVSSAEEGTGCCPSRKVAPTKRVFRDVVTNEELLSRIEGMVNPISQLPEVAKPELDTSQPEIAPGDLMSRSEILQARGAATLVPKRAVLHVPSHLRGALLRPDRAELMIWREFYVRNHSWIDIYEVDRDQIEGRKHLPEELIKSFEKRTKIVVATLNGNPVSVLPVPEVEDETLTAEVENK